MIYLLSYCTSLLTIVHRSFTRATNEVVHFKALSQHKGFSAVADFLWQLHHLELNTMKYDENSTTSETEMMKLKWWNDYQIQKKIVKLALKVESTLGTLQLVLICGIHLV